MKRILVAAAAVITIIGVNTSGAKAVELLDAERIIAAMEDSYDGYTYKNITSQEKFIAALGDSYVPERYQAKADSERYISLLDEKRSEEAFTAGDAPKPVKERDIFTGSFLVLN
ncbi:MAG TPA: hypothetical protein VI728_02380 [Syntrophales bacterium]|nr:hypothetical protein [Syntrophales bacterium]